MTLKDCRLLIVSDRYPHDKDTISSSFVKSQVDCLKIFFERIYIISLTPIVPKLFLNFSFIKPRWQRDAFACNYKYDNVEVFFAKHFALPFEFSRKLRGDLAFRAANKIIKNNNIKFDLIHAHFTYPSGYVSLRLKNIYKKPYIITVHEERTHFLREVASNNKKLVETWRNADKIIRVNKIDLKEFEKFGINKSKLMYITNGFSPDLFKPVGTIIARKKLSLSINSKILVNIANLEEYKGQKYLIHAMKKIVDIHKDAMLYIVGQGSLKSTLQSLINHYGLQYNVILAGGNKPDKEIPLWMNACDAFVLPSLSEGNPTVMFEALGCGKPFVGTNVGGIPEIIINNKLGILVEPKDPEGLAQAILRALEAEWDAAYIREYAKRFKWNRIAERIVGVYEEVLSE